MITDDEFRRIVVFVKQRYGIDLSQKKIIVNGRLENYIRANNWKDFNQFMDVVENDKTGVQEKMLVNFLTTNHTYFMREFEHFDYFRTVILPWVRKKESKSKEVRVWCGAASTGEEPYMIAMVLKDFFGLEYNQWDTRILATDISTQALQQAMSGVYREEQLKNVPQNWKSHFFKAVPKTDQYMVNENLKREVIFRQFNLMDPFPFKKRMHTVFLRNVMIYFDKPTKEALLNKVFNYLEPGGFLFIGTTETLDRNIVPFEIIQPSIFRKQE